jgi:ABC-type transporter Mla subunit MlaD
MDEDLKKLIESTAAETRSQFAETHRQFAETHRQFAETQRQFAEMRGYVEETAAETRRHFDVVAEGLKAKIETVAEGVISANERIDRVDAKVDRLASDMTTEFNDVRSMIKFSHHELDRRVRSLEEVVSQLQMRVERLESSIH